MNQKNRASWDEYFMKIAKVVSTRATCDRLHVGAVIAVDNTQVSSGYNGSPRGTRHCDEYGHILKELGGRFSCVRTTHAEANAIAQAARVGTSVLNGVIYTTASPCYDCMKLIINAGIQKVVYGTIYDSRYGLSEESISLAKEANIEIIFLSDIGP